jgi:hypothetical protein
MGKRTILFLVLLPVVACDKSDPAGPGFEVGTIQFQPGQANVYSWSVGFRDSARNIVEMVTDTFVVRVIGTGETVGSLTGLIKLEAKSIHDDTKASCEWYAQSTSDLRDVAYSGAGHVPVVQPKLHKGLAVNLNRLRRAGLFAEPYLLRFLASDSQRDVDSVVVRDDPRIVYQYPLVVGTQWASFTSPFLETREVVGIEEVTAPAGVFVCVRIRTRIPEFAPDLMWDDMVSTEGLIQRKVELNIVRTNSDMNVVDTVTYVERLDLIQKY